MLPLSKTLSRIKQKRRSSATIQNPASIVENTASSSSEAQSAVLSQADLTKPNISFGTSTTNTTVDPTAPSLPPIVLPSDTTALVALPVRPAETIPVIPISPSGPITSPSHDQNEVKVATLPRSASKSVTMESVTVVKEKPSTAVMKNGSQVVTTATHVVDSVHTNGNSTPTQKETKKTVTESKTLSLQHSDSAVGAVVQFVRGLFSKFGDYEIGMLRHEDLSSYLQNIADERIIHMPRKGSDWDRVLRTAQFFGLQIWRFGEKVGSFAPQSREAAVAALASCHMLLEIGHQQASALLPAFMTLYELGLLVSQLTQIPGIFESGMTVTDDISHLYCDLVDLVGRMAVYYRSHIFNLGPQQHVVTVNLDAAFGQQIDAIWACKSSLYDSIWHQAIGKRTLAIGLAKLRHRLNPDAAAFRHALYEELAEDLERAEDTCEWIKSELIDFLQSNDRFMAVTGGPGSGKTVLADWIEERLQRPIQNTTYSVLLYTFPFDDSDDKTVMAFLKGLLFQLLERSVGNVQLLESLVDALTKKLPQELEQALWKSLSIGLNTFKNSKEPIVLLIDGFEEAAGGSKAGIAGLFKSLQEHVGNTKSVHTVFFSRHDHHLGKDVRQISITSRENYPDISSFLRQTLCRSSPFLDLPPEAREKTIADLVQKAKGSFLWARLAGNYLLKYHGQQSQDLSKNASVISSEVEDVLIAMETKWELKQNHQLRDMLSFLLVSEGPLAVTDLATILAVNVPGRIVGPLVDIPQLVALTVPDLVLVRDGRVRFKSSLIRLHLHKRLGKSLPPIAEAHSQLVLRLLLYVRLVLDAGSPTTDELDGSVANKLFERHPLLVFVTARWQHHFRASSQCQGSELALSKEFRSVFPDTPTFARLQRYAWRASKELVTRLALTLRIGEAVFTAKHAFVLQSLVVLGQVHMAEQRTMDAVRVFYRAVRLAQTLYSQFSSIAIACADWILSVTSTTTFTKRTDIFTLREEMIRFKIEICKERFGSHSNTVVEWQEKLSALYVSINEEHHAAVAYRDLYESVVVREGKNSDHAREITSCVGSLNVVLNDSEDDKDMRGYGRVLLETAEELETNDVLYVSVMLRLAQSYEAEHNLGQAERVYVDLWRRVSILSRTDASVDIQLARLQVALAYVTLLRSLKRDEEASSVLVILWAECQHYSFESEQLVGYLTEIGILLKSLGLLTQSATVFSKVWTWYKTTGKAHGEEARRTTVLITEVVNEITEKSVSTKTTTKTTSETSNTTVIEIYKMQLERCAKEKPDATFFASSSALFNTHMAHNNWSEAETVIKQSLEVSWKSILQGNGKTTTREGFSSETAHLAARLAVCYKKQHQFDKAEEIYLRTYQTAAASVDVEDVLFTKSLSGIVYFYEEHRRYERIVEIYSTVVDKYRKKLGPAHELTVQALYKLAGQHELLGHNVAYDSYAEIVTTLNKGNKHCHPQAFDAAVKLVSFHHTEKRWADLQVFCSHLWETFVHHKEQESRFTEEIAASIYGKYVDVLEKHAKVDVEVLHRISLQYYETTVKMRGKSATSSWTALTALAEVCERSEKHRLEALAMYEEIITHYSSTKTTTTTVTDTTVKTVKTRLSQLYVTVITSEKGTASSETVNRAISVSLEAYTQSKLEFGIWHRATMAKLKDIVVLHQRRNTKEGYAKLVQLLQASFVEIVSTITEITQLYEAASSLAVIYVDCGLIQVSTTFLQQLRYLLIFGNDLPKGTSIKADFQLPKTAHSHMIFLFLAIFENGLLAKVKKEVVLSELLASLMYEALLYEEYTKTAGSKETTIETTLVSGARLRHFWQEEAKSELVAVLDSKLFLLFKTHYANYAKSIAEECVKLFYVVLVEELGRGNSTTQFAVAACRAGNAEVRSRLKAGDGPRAIGIARFAFVFAASQGYYKSHLAGIAYGYELAEILAGVNRADSDGVAQRDDLLAFSKEVTAAVFAALEEEKIDLATLEVADVAGLVRLLGYQADYIRLELLLLHLWQSRKVRRSWSPATVLSIGFALVQAYAGQKKLERAIDLADLLWYNLRRSRGWLDRDTVRISQILAGLYMEVGRVADAMGLCESVLRQIDAVATGKPNKPNKSNGVEHNEDASGDQKWLATNARQYLDLLGSTHARLGRWNKPKKEYHDLYDHLRDALELKQQLPAPFDKWVSSKSPDANLVGSYLMGSKWAIEMGERISV